MPAPRIKAPPTAARGWRGSSHTSAPHATATSGSTNVRIASTARPDPREPVREHDAGDRGRARCADHDAHELRLGDAAEPRPREREEQQARRSPSGRTSRARRRSGRRAVAQHEHVARVAERRREAERGAGERAPRPARPMACSTMPRPASATSAAGPRARCGDAVDAGRRERDQDRRRVVGQHGDSGPSWLSSSEKKHHDVERVEHDVRAEQQVARAIPRRARLAQRDRQADDGHRRDTIGAVTSRAGFAGRRNRLHVPHDAAANATMTTPASNGLCYPGCRRSPTIGPTPGCARVPAAASSTSAAAIDRSGSGWICTAATSLTAPSISGPMFRGARRRCRFATAASTPSCLTSGLDVMPAARRGDRGDPPRARARRQRRRDRSVAGRAPTATTRITRSPACCRSQPARRSARARRAGVARLVRRSRVRAHRAPLHGLWHGVAGARRARVRRTRAATRSIRGRRRSAEARVVTWLVTCRAAAS